MRDRRGRDIDYMRISVTDRCNLRCTYCMPESIPWYSREELLTDAEIVKVCQEAAKLGIRTIRLTGGEPLMRPGCASLVHRLKKETAIQNVYLTTNGTRLASCMEELIQAGLDGVNISLDTLQREKFCQITGKDELSQVLEGIHTAVGSGIPVKINTVLREGVNQEEWDQLVDLARQFPLSVRFIELMPIGHGKQGKGVSNVWLLEQFREKYPQIRPDQTKRGKGPASYWKIPGFQGGVGFISAIHGKFCGDCNRIRMTATGELKPCLCYGETVSVRDAVRKNDGEAVRKCLEQAISEKPEAHQFDTEENISEKREMSKIGG